MYKRPDFSPYNKAFSDIKLFPHVVCRTFLMPQKMYGEIDNKTITFDNLMMQIQLNMPINEIQGKNLVSKCIMGELLVYLNIN